MQTFNVESLVDPVRDLMGDVENPEVREYRFRIPAHSEKEAVQIAKEKHDFSVWESDVWDDTDYRWEWVVKLNGVEVGRGVRELSEGQMYDFYGTTNLDRLIEELGTVLVTAPDGSVDSNVKYSYKRLY